MNATGTARAPRVTLKPCASSAARILTNAQIAAPRPIGSNAVVPLAAAPAPGQEQPAPPRPLAINRRALLMLLGVRADHCARSFFVWRAPAVRESAVQSMQPACADQRFAIALVAGAGADGVFQCEVTSGVAGGKVSVWHVGARLVGEFVLLSPHQEEEFNEFLRRLEAARAGGARYVEAQYAGGGTARATATAELRPTHG